LDQTLKIRRVNRPNEMSTILVLHDGPRLYFHLGRTAAQGYPIRIPTMDMSVAMRGLHRKYNQIYTDRNSMQAAVDQLSIEHRWWPTRLKKVIRLRDCSNFVGLRFLVNIPMYEEYLLTESSPSLLCEFFGVIIPSRGWQPPKLSPTT
jgi:hypothetical protein